MRQLPSNLTMTDPYWEPFTKDELEARYDEFLEEDAGNGNFIEDGERRIFENGAVWHHGGGRLHLARGRVRGPLSPTSHDYIVHRQSFVGARKREIDQLKAKLEATHSKVRRRIEHVRHSGGTLPDQAEVSKIEELRKLIARKEDEFRKLTAPERELEWSQSDMAKAIESEKFGQQDAANEMLKRIGPQPFSSDHSHEEKRSMYRDVSGSHVATTLGGF